METSSEKQKSKLIILKWSLGLAVCFVFLSILSGLGNRFGWWDFRRGFSLLTAGFYGASFTLFLSILGLYTGRKEKPTRKLIWGIPSLLLSLILIGVPVNWMSKAKKVPRIHDITTDTLNPPVFVTILPLRKDAPNSAIYGGSEIAWRQKKGYPDLKPAIVPMDAEPAFQKSVEAAKKMGWTLVDINPSERRIEATDTTFWFGFKDDIVIRVIPVMGASRIDIRSVSRVGLSDVGTNAERIRKYLKTLTETIGSS